MDAKKLTLIMNVLKFGLVGLGVILCLTLFNGPNMESPLAEQADFREGASLGLATSYTGFIFFAGIGLILLFFVVQLISNPKKTIISIVGLLAALVLYFIISMGGTSDTNESLALRDPVSLETIASTTAGLWTAIIGVVAGLVLVLLGPLMGRYRK